EDEVAVAVAHRRTADVREARRVRERLLLELQGPVGVPRPRQLACERGARPPRCRVRVPGEAEAEWLLLRGERPVAADRRALLVTGDKPVVVLGERRQPGEVGRRSPGPGA